MKGHKTAKANLKGAELNTSSWVHAHIDGHYAAAHMIKLEVRQKDASGMVMVYVDEAEIDAMIATLREFKRNAMLTNREFAVMQQNKTAA